MKNISSFLLIFLISTLGTVADEVWISPVGTDNTGSGTAADPYVCSSQSSFDALMDGSTIPTNSIIHLMAGTFLTQGQIEVKSAWKVRGAGIDVTIVRIVPLSSAPAGGYVHAFGGPAWYYNTTGFGGVGDGVEVSDMTIDCNLQNQAISTACGAVFLQGANTKISRVKAINWGSTSSGTENFIFDISAGWLNPMAITNCLIEDCIVEQPAQVTLQQGSDGFVIGGDVSAAGSSPTNSFSVAGSCWVCGAEIRDCRISGVNVGDGVTGGVGEPAYFIASTMGNGVFGAKLDDNMFINIVGSGGCSFRTSCGSLADCTIVNNMFLNVSTGINFASSDYCPDNTNSLKENILIANNFITLQSGGYGINMSGIFGQSITNLTVENNTIMAADGSGAVNDLAVQTINNFTAQNNVFDANGGAAMTIQPDVVVSLINNNNNLGGTNVYAPSIPTTGDLLIDGALNATLGSITFTNGTMFEDGYPVFGGVNNANVAIGRAAMLYSQDQTNSGGNVAIGIQAMLTSTNAGGNIAIGPCALSPVQANYNTAVGAYSMMNDTVGAYNIGVGGYTLWALTNGSDNTAIGSIALENDTSGVGNIALGCNAGLNITVGNYNIEIGNAGLLTDSYTTRLGAQGYETNVYIAGITNSLLTNNSVLVIRPDGLVGVNDNIAAMLNSLTNSTSTNSVVWNSISITNSVAQNWASISVTASNAIISMNGVPIAALQTNGVLNAYKGLSTTVNNAAPASTFIINGSGGGAHVGAKWTNTNAWNAVVYVNNGSVGDVYYNGAVISTNTTSATVMMQPGSTLSITNSSFDAVATAIHCHPF